MYFEGVPLIVLLFIYAIKRTTVIAINNFARFC